MVAAFAWRFAWASFGECHQAGHLLWNFADPEHSDYVAEAPADVRDGLMRVYEATDRAIGGVIEGLPEGTAVLVVSPYDMAPNHHLDEVLQLVLERGGWAVRAAGKDATMRVRSLAAGRRVVQRQVGHDAHECLPRRLYEHPAPQDRRRSLILL